MKTRFHISITSGVPLLTSLPPDLSGVRSMWISVQGPHGPGLAHLPEVVLFVALMNVRRVDVRLRAPQRRRLVVGRQALLRVALEDGRVQPALVQAPHLRQQLPRPADRFLLEVVAERPVAEHLEEGVVIGVLAHVVEVVVLAAGPDALLRIDRALVRPRARAEEHVLELVHARVGEQQRRVVVRHDGAGRHDRVAVLLGEEVEELLTDLVGAAMCMFPGDRPRL